LYEPGPTPANSLPEDKISIPLKALAQTTGFLTTIFINYFLVGLKTFEKVPDIHCSLLNFEVLFFSENFYYFLKIGCGFVILRMSYQVSETSHIEIITKFNLIHEKEWIGDTISSTCKGYGVSRKTYYKWNNRYKRKGIEGLSDSSRRPHNIKYKKITSEVQEIIFDLRLSKRFGCNRIKFRLRKVVGISLSTLVNGVSTFFDLQVSYVAEMVHVALTFTKNLGHPI
jgi:transposase